jgi:hypothetical protein
MLTNALAIFMDSVQIIHLLIKMYLMGTAYATHCPTNVRVQ